MATPADPGIALLSIHPRYAQAIMAGTKRVEFRKQTFARPVSHIVIYETAPTGRIVGAARVAACHVASPAELWKRYGDVGAIDPMDFDGYYAGREEGVAIQLDGPPVPLDLPLSAIGQRRPPQNFAYLGDESLGVLGLHALPAADVQAHVSHGPISPLRRRMRRVVHMVGRPVRWLTSTLRTIVTKP